MDPGFTNFKKRSIYSGFDVTKQLIANRNAIGVMLGNGYAWGKAKATTWTDNVSLSPRALLEIHITYTDGSKQVIVTDGAWKGYSQGPIVKDNVWDGEEYDARLEQSGWDRIGFQEKGWLPAKVVENPSSSNRKLNAQYQAIKIIEEFPQLLFLERARM